MLRPLALFLLLANGWYFAWAHGLLLPYGFGPAQQSEPQHMRQQIEPGAMRILSPQEATALQAEPLAEPARPACWQAGPLDSAQIGTLRQSLAQKLPADAWSLDTRHTSARWIVYMGKYPTAEALAKKRAEVAALNLPVERLDNATLEPGLSLGGFDTKAAADAALVSLGARGLHTARVVQERAESAAYWLKVYATNAAIEGHLSEVRALVGGKPLGPCIN